MQNKDTYHIQSSLTPLHPSSHLQEQNHHIQLTDIYSKKKGQQSSKQIQDAKIQVSFQRKQPTHAPRCNICLRAFSRNRRPFTFPCDQPLHMCCEECISSQLSPSPINGKIILKCPYCGYSKSYTMKTPYFREIIQKIKINSQILELAQELNHEILSSNTSSVNRVVLGGCWVEIECRSKQCTSLGQSEWIYSGFGLTDASLVANICKQCNKPRYPARALLAGCKGTFNFKYPRVPALTTEIAFSAVQSEIFSLQGMQIARFRVFSFKK